VIREGKGQKVKGKSEAKPLWIYASPLLFAFFLLPSILFILSIPVNLCL
jgi:hypothetical protein